MIGMRNKYWAIVLVFMLIGCSVEESEDMPEHIKEKENLSVNSADPNGAGEIELTEMIQYGETNTNFLGREIEHFAVDETGGVTLTGVGDHAVHLFAPDGSYLKEIGGEGRGPGEFLVIRDIEVYKNHLYVLDSRQLKISVFDLNTSTHVRDMSISLENQSTDEPEWMEWARDAGLFYRPIKIFIRNEESLFIVFADETVGMADNVEGRTHEISKFDLRTDQFSKHDLLSFPWTGQLMIHNGMDQRLVLYDAPHKRSTIFDYKNGRFVMGWTDELLFSFYDSSGEYQNAIYIRYQNAPFNEEMLLSKYQGANEVLTKALTTGEQPDTWPAFSSLLLDDDNRLWVSVITENPQKREWWVLDDSGDLLATLSLNRNQEITKVISDDLYVLVTDIDSNLQEIIKYQFRLP